MAACLPIRFLFLALCLGLLPSLAALNVSLPFSFSWSNASNVSLAFSVSGNASSCALYTNESSWSAVLNTSSINASNNSFSRALSQGFWSWSVACSDGNGTVFAPNSSVGVDLTPPNASVLSVSGFVMSWSYPVSDDLSGFSKFELFRNNSLVFNTTNSSVFSFTDSAAAANASYAYRLDVVDSAGNRNSSFVLFEPLRSISTLLVTQVGPRVLNVSWTTVVPANESVTLIASNGTSIVYSSSALSTNHSLNITPPVFGQVSGTVTSCARACFNQTFSYFVPPTINISMVFYNATYNKQEALLSLRLDSQYGLTFVSAFSNNSGANYSAFSSILSSSKLHLENLTFVVNESAREIVWLVRAVDVKGDEVSSLYSLRFSPNTSQYVEPTFPNTSFVALVVGQELNVSNGFRLRLLGLSNVPVGVSNLLSAVLETYFPSGELESRFYLEENGSHNTTSVAVQLYRVFLGIGNNSYAQINAFPIFTPTPTPTTSATLEPTLTPTPSATPTPSPSPSTEPTASPPVFGGRMASTNVVVPSSNGSILSGYVLAEGDLTSVSFNSTYENEGDSLSIFLQVRVVDPSLNRTVAVARSVPRNATRDMTLFFSTETVTLSPGEYNAEALIVAADNDVVIDTREFKFTVLQPGVSDAVRLVALLGVLALGVFAFALRINHHKKGLFS